MWQKKCKDENVCVSSWWVNSRHSTIKESWLIIAGNSAPALLLLQLLCWHTEFDQVFSHLSFYRSASLAVCFADKQTQRMIMSVCVCGVFVSLCKRRHDCCWFARVREGGNGNVVVVVGKSNRARKKHR